MRGLRKRIIRMRIFIFAIAFLFCLSLPVAYAQQEMCESVQNHIKSAKSLGGETKAREKISQILGAHKYLRKRISEAELVRCILLTGASPDHVRNEAIKAGIPPHTVETALVEHKRSLPPGEAPVAAAAEEPAGEDLFSSTAESALSLDVITKDMDGEGGVSSGPGCNQISPWTWCAN